MPVSLRAPRSTAARSARVFSDGACATISSRLGMPRSTMIKKLLIANRGEIAIRIAEAAAELGIATVGIHSEDDANSLHIKRVDEVKALKGTRSRRLSRHRGRDRRRQGRQVRRHPSGLRLPVGERRFRARLAPRRRSLSSGRRPSSCSCSATRPRRARMRQKCKVPVLPGTDGAVDVGGRRGLLQEAREVAASRSRPSPAAAGAACA